MDVYRLGSYHLDPYRLDSYRLHFYCLDSCRLVIAWILIGFLSYCIHKGTCPERDREQEPE